MKKRRGKGTTSIGIAVSLGGSSEGGLKIVKLHTDGSTVTTTLMASITRAGISYIRSHGWQRMYESSGAKAIVEKTEIGNDQTWME